MIHLTLLPDEQTTLEALIAHPQADLPVKRLQIVLLAADGRGAPEISEMVALHPINVRKWIHRYARCGVDGLRNQAGAGRPRMLTTQQRAEIATIYASNPRALGLQFTEWTLKRLKDYLIDRGMVKHISIETLRTCINEAAK